MMNARLLKNLKSNNLKLNTCWITQKMRFRSIAWATCLGLAVAAAVAPGGVRAQGDDEDKTSIWNLDKRIFDGFAKGLGLQRGDTPGIDYRERSPLVVPPSRNLPPPETEGASRNAAWPVDPDAKRRVERSGSKKKLDSRGFDENYQGRALSPSELNPAGSRGRTASDSKPAGNGDVDGKPALPSELGYSGGLWGWSSFGFGGQKDEQGTFTKEPPRNSLTVPPTGYQTPSAQQPYGVSKERARQTVTPLDPAVGSGLGR
jgi:hypothetical protein